MELPNYSRQLMQQMQTLRKESLFCDCTILVGDVTHPAHKVVLAASSLLFKSLLETSDSISIDTAVVTEQEFSSLLDMAYLGRLVPGKHDFARVVAAADSLQMFDVAVGCKNLLDELVKRPGGAEGVKDHSDEPRRLDASGREFSSQGCCDTSKSPRNRQESQNDGAVELLSRKRDDLIKILQDVQPWINIFRTWDMLSNQQRHMFLECSEGEPCVAFQRLLDQVKEARDVSVQPVIMLLEQIKNLKPDLKSAEVEEEEKLKMLDIKGGAEEKVARSSGYQHGLATDLTDYLKGVENIPELFTQTADRCEREDVKQVLLECSGEESHGQVLKKLMSVLAERGIEQTSVLRLLKEVVEGNTKSADQRTDERVGMSLLRTFQNTLRKLNLDSQIIRQGLEEGPHISPEQREVLQKESDGKVEELLNAALDGGPVQPLTVWRLLFWAATHIPDLQLMMQDIRAKPEAQELIHTVGRVDALFKHKKLILETINEIPDLEKAVGDLDRDKDVAEFLQSCRGAGRNGVHAAGSGPSTERGNAAHRSALPPLSVSRTSFPQLSVLIEELGHVGLNDHEDTADSEKEEEEKGESRPHRRRKDVVVSYSCQWCNKSFDFKCRLLKHKKQCALCPERAQRCTECSTAFASVTALQQHRVEAHNGPPVKRKKVEPVTCELCGKTFKHPSGLLYHRRTEHLEERPYACEECGAKFAANSSLKNHMRLHTGEKPYRCKHCDMSFAVAAALSYHTKKKHSEGKMYSCQYCSATFAQSIELTRHVRTHTGDKPYVCRECGKGFKQANGLSVHLQTFHNISDPHDCQKCRVSFGCLEKLREHIQEVHPKDLHQCPECSKILSTEAQLEKHMSVHDGSKPYSCQRCNKSYQTLSGLWYHNRTTHPDEATAEGGRSISHLLHCKICEKTFCNRSSLFKHNITKHPETRAVADEGVKEGQAGVLSDAVTWRCGYCPRALSSEQELQQHMSSEHVSQQRSVFACTICSLSFHSEAEFQQHLLTNHVQLVQEEELQNHGSTTQMVIQTEHTSAEGAAQIVGLDQSQLSSSQQVFVALGDGGEAEADSGIIAVNMEDLLTGRVTLICEENQ
ncbi:LOW QUALITY PROTEIN: zinc finger and BTB domain-containing protein 40 [Silurus meridionalis]|uniref:LOW QUALITY PROTEIN: zinc finger and BTB domain-containing protein 40 n=1 Tax=Silurus meridionalis TaxID=175797 RepID=UPI001EEC1608|nr:LOW QUALITY PROTEIN: zinc finger and BTB domain-containing protein 40 [Silurus meridionalis]